MDQEKVLREIPNVHSNEEHQNFTEPSYCGDPAKIGKGAQGFQTSNHKRAVFIGKRDTLRGRLVSRSGIRKYYSLRLWTNIDIWAKILPFDDSQQCNIDSTEYTWDIHVLAWIVLKSEQFILKERGIWFCMSFTMTVLFVCSSHIRWTMNVATSVPIMDRFSSVNAPSFFET